MNKIAIIGGTGLTQLEGLTIKDIIEIDTPWGKPSAPITVGEFNKKEILFLPRHGHPHTIPPHKVNYRANIWALNETGVNQIIAVNAVGGITERMTPCAIVIPDQLIDYTYDRKHTFFEDDLIEVKHIDFSWPYSNSLRLKIIDAAKDKVRIVERGTYGVTQGPRLETSAEIKKLENDGCDIVGMTSMPEATLARELEIEYACVALVVNWGAGKTDEEITMDIIENNLKEGIDKIKILVASLLNSQ